MKHNFYAAYKYFLQTLATYSESQNTQNSFFSKTKFQLHSANGDTGLDLESSQIRDELLTVVEPTLMEELEDYMLSDMT